MSRLPKVVIVGAGFAGLNAAKALKGAPVEITIIDRRNFHLFQPLLYQVAAAALNPSDIAYPIRSIFRRQANITGILLAEVTHIDLERRVVRLDDSTEVAYEYLIVAAGATHSYFGNDDVGGGGSRSEDDRGCPAYPGADPGCIRGCGA